MSPLSCSSASPHSSAAVGGGKGFESTEQKKKEGEKESREEASEHGGKKEKRATAQQKKGGEWNLGPASTVLHRGSTCNHAAAREHVVLRSMVSRKRGEKKRQKSMQRGARGFISTAAVAVERVFFFFFFFFPIVVVAPKEARASPLSFDAAAASSSHGDGIRTATISGSQWETELPMTVLL